MKRNSFKRTIAQLGKCLSPDVLEEIKVWFENVTHTEPPIILVFNWDNIQLLKNFHTFTVDFGPRNIDLVNWQPVKRNHECSIVSNLIPLWRQ